MKVYNRLFALSVSGKDDCSYVWQVPANERCDWVRATQDCSVGSFVPYPTLLFCSFGTESSLMFALGLALLVFWLLYLFLILGTTADNLYNCFFFFLFFF